jgi:hypothetical protein
MDSIRARRRAQCSIAAFAVVTGVAAFSSVPPLGAQGKGNGGGDDGVGASPAFEATIESAAADITIRQWRVTADGARAGVDPPAVSVRVEAARNGSAWRTSLSMTGLDRPVARGLAGPQALDNPFLVSRLEYDDDGTPPRMFNARGQLMAMPGENERRALGLPEGLRDKNWDPSAVLGRVGAPGRGPDRTGLAGLVVGVADAPKRRADVERHFGKRIGQVRGHDQFILRSGAQVDELLITPDTAVPVELNETTEGELTARMEFEYDAQGADALVRRHVRAERAIGKSGGERMVTDLSVTNLTLVRRGDR